MMLRTLTTLLVFQLIGEALSFGFRLPIPGPVIGMTMLFIVLIARPAHALWMKDTAQELLRHLSLLFVPAGVGVMMYLDTVRREWLPIAVSLVLSTGATIMVTALTVQWVQKWMTSRGARSEMATFNPGTGVASAIERDASSAGEHVHDPEQHQDQDQDQDQSHKAS